MKACRVCAKEKPLEDYYPRRDSADGREARCKACRLAYNRENYDKSAYVPAARRARHYRRTYGVTMGELEAMRTQQGGKCALCGRSEADSHNGLHLDHDHRPGGVVRSLLCADCNTGIGKLQDDPDLLRRAAEYIERHRSDN